MKGTDRPTSLEYVYVSGCRPRIAKNHPLTDWNKRLAWQSLTMFRILNGYRLEVATDDAVDLMLAAAAGELTETEVAAWLAERLQPLNSA